jgi:hypothetical protein
MPRVGFEPMISMLDWAKTVHALDSATTVIGICFRLNIFLILETHQPDTVIHFSDFLSFLPLELYIHRRIVVQNCVKCKSQVCKVEFVGRFTPPFGRMMCGFITKTFCDQFKEATSRSYITK